jgi:hypothetical protein
VGSSELLKKVSRHTYERKSKRKSKMRFEFKFEVKDLKESIGGFFYVEFKVRFFKVNAKK